MERVRGELYLSTLLALANTMGCQNGHSVGSFVRQIDSVYRLLNN